MNVHKIIHYGRGKGFCKDFVWMIITQAFQYISVPLYDVRKTCIGIWFHSCALIKDETCVRIKSNNLICLMLPPVTDQFLRIFSHSSFSCNIFLVLCLLRQFSHIPVSLETFLFFNQSKL